MRTFANVRDSVSVADRTVADNSNFADCVKVLFSTLRLPPDSRCGDIYGFFILLAFGLNECAGAVQRPREEGQAPAQVTGLNILSVAEMTGIPRETVRRKIKVLVEKGVIAPTPHRTYVMTERAEIDDRIRPMLKLLRPRS